MRMVQDKMFRGYREAFAGTGVTPAVHAILMIIRDNPGIRQGVVADALMVKAPNVTGVLASLEKAGLVSRTIDAGDSRVIDVTLTDAGRRLLDELQERLDAFEQKILGGLDPHEQQDLRALLTRLSTPKVQARSPAR